MVLTSTKLWKECDETQKTCNLSYQSKNSFFLIERKSKLGHYQVKIENRKLRIPIGYLSRFSILNSYKDWVSNCQLTFEQYFTIIVERCMMLSQMQFHKLRLLFGHILGMQREIAVFIHLAHFCRFEVKTITPRNFWKPLEKYYCLVSKYH